MIVSYSHHMYYVTMRVCLIYPPSGGQNHDRYSVYATEGLDGCAYLTGTRGPDWQGWWAGSGPRAASWTTLVYLFLKFREFLPTTFKVILLTNKHKWR